MRAYNVARISGSDESFMADLALVFPEGRIVVDYSARHIAQFRCGFLDRISLTDNDRKFEPHDLGFERLEQLEPEAWIEYMGKEYNTTGHNRYLCVQVEVDDEVVEVLRQKIELNERKVRVEKGLQKIVFEKNPVLE